MMALEQHYHNYGNYGIETSGQEVKLKFNTDTALNFTDLYLTRNPQTFPPSRNFSCLDPQKFPPAKQIQSAIRKIFLPQKFHPTL